jgi:hypothetical protein
VDAAPHDSVLTPRETSARFDALALRIRRGDERAPADFHLEFRAGVRALFRKHLGGVAVDRMTEEAIAGSVEEIRRGWIRDLRDLLLFFHELARQYPQTKGLAGATDQCRVRVKAARIEQEMRHLSQAQREALRLYYVEGWTAARAQARTGISADEFRAGREQLLRAADGTTFEPPARQFPRTRLAKRASA